MNRIKETWMPRMSTSIFCKCVNGKNIFSKPEEQKQLCKKEKYHENCQR